MKSEYETKMYEFYTKNENFETMLHVAEQAEWVSQQVIRSFWEDVKQELNATMQEKDKEWIVSFSNYGDWNTRWLKLQVYRQEWYLSDEYPIVSIAAEDLHLNRNPYVGVTVNNDSKSIDGAGLKSAIKDLEVLKDYQSDSNAYWARWKHFDFRHYGFDSLTQLLPENRETTISNVVSEFETLIDLTADHILPLLNEHKNS